MKKQIIGFSVSIVLLCCAGMAQPTLVTIGSATYNGSNYNLIWDNNNNGKSVVWLDYRNPSYNASYVSATDNNWAKQMTWASGLGNEISSYNIDPKYNITWNDNDPWRLPTTLDGPFDFNNNYDGTGYGGFNITYSELGHLFYTELGNKGYLRVDGTAVPVSEQGIKNSGDFHNFGDAAYWSSTKSSVYTDSAWLFGMDNGFENIGQFNPGGNDNVSGIALRTAQVSTTSPVPEPATMLLFGISLAGLAGVRWRKKAC